MASLAFCAAFVTIASAMSSIAAATEAGDWYLLEHVEESMLVEKERSRNGDAMMHELYYDLRNRVACCP